MALPSVSGLQRKNQSKDIMYWFALKGIIIKRWEQY